MKLILFGTQDCHLCEQAVDLIRQVATEVDLEYVDIARSEALTAEFGVRIPVIRSEMGSELGWPFDLKMLETFIRESYESF